jgi:hypothetical protein
MKNTVEFVKFYFLFVGSKVGLRGIQVLIRIGSLKVSAKGVQVLNELDGRKFDGRDRVFKTYIQLKNIRGHFRSPFAERTFS